MGSMDIWAKLAEHGIVVVLMGAGIYYLYKQNDKLQLKLDTYETNYRGMAEKTLKVITLTDDRLSKKDESNEKINDIHRIVGELKIIFQNWKSSN